jgi:hypothetical protein
MLSLRSTLSLCAVTLLLAAWTCWTVASAGTVPAFWLGSASLAPHLIAGFCIVLAAIAAPLFFSQTELINDAPWIHLGKAAHVSLWLAAAAAFMMMTAARVSPINGSGIVGATIWIFSVAFTAIVLNRIAPRVANSILFVWIIALPIAVYMAVEVFLTSPAGGSGLADSNAPQATALRTAARWMLMLSPSTGTLGALTGTLPFDNEFSPAITFGELFTLTIFLALLTLRKRVSQN